MFKLNRKNGVSYYTITSFEETGLVKHGFSTREGGVSDGCYSSMNFRFHCDDTRENVLKNFEIMADTLLVWTIINLCFQNKFTKMLFIP